jgi:hypothetical protein
VRDLNDIDWHWLEAPDDDLTVLNPIEVASIDGFHVSGETFAFTTDDGEYGVLVTGTVPELTFWLERMRRLLAPFQLFETHRRCKSFWRDGLMWGCRVHKVHGETLPKPPDAP